MSGAFGGGGAQKRARKDAQQLQAQARRETQRSNEEAGRERQRGERGVSRGGRALLIGNLSRFGADTLGGG